MVAESHNFTFNCFVSCRVLFVLYRYCLFRIVIVCFLSLLFVSCRYCLFRIVYCLFRIVIVCFISFIVCFVSFIVCFLSLLFVSYRYCLFLIAIVCFVSLLFVSYRSMYCLCVNVYCTSATGWSPIAVNKYIISYFDFKFRHIHYYPCNASHVIAWSDYI